MAEIINTVALPEIISGPDCQDCPARLDCPGMNLLFEIAELNEDLSKKVVPEEIKIRVAGEYFASGIAKFQRKVSHIQSGINDCLGPVQIERGGFLYPSFGMAAGRDDRVLQTTEELKLRGFDVETYNKGDTEVIGKVSDPNVIVTFMDIGLFNISGLRGVVSDLRSAASFKIK